MFKKGRRLSWKLNHKAGGINYFFIRSSTNTTKSIMNTMMMMMMLQIPLLCQEGFIVQHPFIAVCTGNRSLAFDIINLQTASLANQIWMGLASDSHHRVADPFEMSSRTGSEMGFVRRVARQTHCSAVSIDWLWLPFQPAFQFRCHWMAECSILQFG